MLDGIDACDHCAAHAFGAVGMRGHPKPVIPGRGDNGFDLGHGELRVLAACGLTQHAAGGRELDQVRAFLVTGAYGLVGIVHAVHDALRRPRHAAQLAVDAVARVGVPAGGGETLAGGVDARPDDVAFGDRPAERLGHSIARAEIPYRGESRHERAFRVGNRPQCHVGGFERKAFQELVWILLAPDVHVHVDPSGHDERVGQVDVRFAHKARLHGHDAIAVHDDGCTVDHVAGGSVEQLAGVDDRLRPGASGQEQCRYQGEESHGVASFLYV